MTASTVHAAINYTGLMRERPQFHANDQSLDRATLDSHVVPITDVRSVADAPTLDREGFALTSCPTSVADFRDAAEVAAVHAEEIRRFIQELTGADAVVVTGPGVLRFAERSDEAGTRDNSRAARLVHIDTSDSAAGDFAQKAAPAGRTRFRRIAQHNIWRAFSKPPQDVPLAVCDARTVAADDLVPADARFDRDGKIQWSFEALLLRYNAAHRWCFYSGMERDED